MIDGGQTKTKTNNGVQNMQSSAEINELASALAKAQGSITGALKDSANPFFKSKYADLASCWDACRTALSVNGLSVVQCPDSTAEGITFLDTTLMHLSGQWIRSRLIVQCKDNTPQAMGSGMTYARRYAFAAMIGIAQIDDDGNAASGRGHDPRGDMGKEVPKNTVQETVQHMLKLLDEDIVGDHEGIKKAAIVLDYHENKLNPDPDLYVAVGDALPAAKKNAWKAFVSQAKKLESQEPKGRKF
jgi:ERF superfamily